MVDLLVLVGLERLHPVEAAALLHHHRHLVGLSEFFSGGEDVRDTIEYNSNGLVILGREEVTERLQDSLQERFLIGYSIIRLSIVHLSTKMDDLLDCAAAGQVGHRPGRLLLGLEVSLDEDVNQRLEAASVNHELDLRVVTRRDVTDGPSTLLKIGKFVNRRETKDILFRLTLGSA